MVTIISLGHRVSGGTVGSKREPLVGPFAHVGRRHKCVHCHARLHEI